jgi:NADH-quinone oxidoreductase subunit M
MNMFNTEFILQYLIWVIAFLPLIGSVLLLFTRDILTIKRVGLFFSFLTFFLSLFLWVFFDKSYSRFQFVSELSWSPLANLNFSLGIDGISLFFVILTTLLFPLCLLMSWNSVTKKIKEYIISFLVMETLLILVFSVRDLLLFYIFFEGVLIPMFIIIGIWGSRERKIRASYMFFLYTLFGSVLMLLSILYHEQ